MGNTCILGDAGRDIRDSEPVNMQSQSSQRCSWSTASWVEPAFSRQAKAVRKTQKGQHILFLRNDSSTGLSETFCCPEDIGLVSQPFPVGLFIASCRFLLKWFTGIQKRQLAASSFLFLFSHSPLPLPVFLNHPPLPRGSLPVSLQRETIPVIIITM